MKRRDQLKMEWANTGLPPGQIALWSLGQAGVVIKGRSADGFVALDPYLSSAIESRRPGTEFRRAFSPPANPEDLAGVRVVLVTHEHDDHLDPETLGPIARVSPDTVFCVPAPLVGSLAASGVRRERVYAAVAGVPAGWGGIRVTPVPAAHAEYILDECGNHRFLGYFLEMNEVRLYHAGDTVVTEELLALVRDFAPHVVLLPINGGDYFRTGRGIVGNMLAREAADFAVAAGADLVIPIHWDMFPNNRDNPAHFVDYWLERHFGRAFHMLAPGERFLYAAPGR